MTASVNITGITSRDLKSRRCARRVKGVIDNLVVRTRADVVFMKKYYPLHEEYLNTLKK